jgi:hypothetical protein
MKLETQLGVFFAHSVLARGFTIRTSSAPTTRGTSRELSPLFATPQASLVSVCTAELCCCQDDDLGGDEILAELLSRNLPFDVDEAHCLGACGVGAMIAIDFEDGTSALVTGLQETLFELGLSDDQAVEPAIYSTEPVALESTLDPPVASNNLKAGEVAILSSNEETTILSPKPPATLEEITDSSKSKRMKKNKTSSELVDVRERMRAEASKKDEENVNPWLNVASYLAGKAAQQVFGDKK